MKKEVIVFCRTLLTLLLVSFQVDAKQNLFVQAEREIVPSGEEPSEAKEPAKAEAIENPVENARAREEQKAASEQARVLNALREKSAETTEYTLDPSSVELVVEMDPNGYGFRTRAHRMSLSADVDVILRGRGVLHYDFRFFNYLSAGVLFGVDWSDASLVARIRDQMSGPAPKQFTLLGGVSAKWRLTEWYMRSALFLEPSVLFGHMWQTLVAYKTTHWRIRPGLFGGVETVFDSGLTCSARLGVEFPVDFGSPNPVTEYIDPLFLIGFGFAI